MEHIILWTYIEIKREFRHQGYGKKLSQRAEQIAYQNGATRMIGWLLRRSVGFFESIGHLVIDKQKGSGQCEKILTNPISFELPPEIEETIEEKDILLDTKLFPFRCKTPDKTMVISWYKNKQLVGLTRLKLDVIEE